MFPFYKKFQVKLKNVNNNYNSITCSFGKVTKELLTDEYLIVSSIKIQLNSLPLRSLHSPLSLTFLLNEVNDFII